MKICPQCHDEYRDDIATCLQCDISLEAVLPGMKPNWRSTTSIEEIDLSTAVKVFEGQIDACREIEALLKREKIACALVPHSKVDVEHLGRAVMTSKAATYLLCVNADKVDAYVAIMKMRFDEMVTKEHSKDFVLNDVHLDGGEVQCPACGHIGALVAGHCADCELFLGVNEA